MKAFIKNRKLVFAAVIAFILMLAMAVTAFAEGGEGAEHDYWSDPLFFEFIFLVVAFFSVIICTALIAHAVKNRNKIHEYEESEGTVKLYEDLDDAKWDAPDSVFIDALEPTAAILSELEPVKPVRGLDGFVITEQPIEPAKAMNMGADPYAFRAADDIRNAIYEAVPSTEITIGDLDSRPEVEIIDGPTETPYIESLKEAEKPYVYQNVSTTPLEDDHIIAEAKQPIDPASSPLSSPFTYIAPSVVPGSIPFATPFAAVYENNYNPTSLEDPVIPVAETPVNISEPVTPGSKPITYLDVPITIYTSGDEDGVVQINASIFENTVKAVELKDDPVIAPVAEPAPIPSVITPMSEPLANTFAPVEAPVEIPTTEANIFENNIVTVALEDEIAIPVVEPTVIPEVITPASEPLANTFAPVETPVEIPATEANIFENNIVTVALEDEIVIPTVEPTVIPEVITPASEPLANTFAPVEAPVEIPATEANIFENNIVTVALEDEIVIPVAEPTVIPEVITPASKPLANTFAPVEAPVEIPATEANIFENNIVTVALEDEISIPVAEPAPIPSVITPMSEPLANTFAPVEAAVEIPATEANIFENNIVTVALEDEIVIPVVEPTVVPEVITPASEPLANTFAPVEAPVEIPATEANIFENNIVTVALEDEIVIPVAEPTVIPEVITPASEPLANTFAPVEAAVEIPATEANIFENNIVTVALEDEIVIPTVEPTVVPEVITPASEPLANTFAPVEAAVEIPATEANIFENNIVTVALEDEIVIPVVEPTVVPEVITPASEPLANTFAPVEAPVEIPATEANIFENNIVTVALEDEIVIPTVEPTVIPEVITPTSEPLANTFAPVEAPVEIPATEANIFENNIVTVALEDEIVIPTVEPTVIPEVITPASEPLANTFAPVEAPVEIPATEANIFENNIVTVALEDEIVIPVVEPTVVPEVITPASEPLANTFAPVEAAVEIPATEANIFENNIVTVALEDEIAIPVAEPTVIPEVITPASEPLANTFAPVEAPVEIPATEANIFENNIVTVALEDEIVIPTVEPTVVPEVITPASEPLANTFAPVEAPVEIPATEANIFENNIVTVALEDEIVIPTVEPTVVPEVITPASEPLANTFAPVEAAVEIPATEANIFENNIVTVALEDEIVIPVVEPTVVPEVITPASEPLANTFAPVEAPVEIPATEANIFENNVSNITLEDEPKKPTIIEPVIVPEATTPAAEPMANMFTPAEAAVEIPATEAAVFEVAPATVLEDEVAEPVVVAPIIVPVDEAATPASEPMANTFVTADEPVVVPTIEAAVFEVAPATILEDEAAEPVAIVTPVTFVDEAATPASEPMANTFVTADEPVVVPATEAAVFEVAPATVLEDEKVEPVVIAPIIVPVDEAATPAAEPMANMFTPAEAAIEIPATEAAVFEVAPATVLEDEKVEPVVIAPIIVPVDEAATPASEPMANTFVTADEPVVVPTTEAAVFEVAPVTVLEDEKVEPIVVAPIIIPVDEAATPAAEPMANTFVTADEPVVVPATEASVFEVAPATVLEDEATEPVVSAPIIVPVDEAATPAAEPMANTFVTADEPVVVPATEASVFEVAPTTILEDEAAEPIVIAPIIVPIDEAATPAAEPMANMFTPAEAAVEIPATEAAVFEVAPATILEDEATEPVVVAPIIVHVDEAATPAAEPMANMFTPAEAAIEIPATEAAVFEVAPATVLEDEATEPVVIAPIIVPVDEAATPAAEPMANTFVTADEPVVVPTTEAAVFEVAPATILEDEKVEPVVIAPIIIPVDEAATPASEPMANMFTPAEAAIEIPTTEAAVFEVAPATVLEDEKVEPVVIAPIIVPVDEAATPASEPMANMFTPAEASVEIPASEAAVFEIAPATVLEDEKVEPVVIAPIIVPVDEAATPAAEPMANTFVTADEPVVVPTTEAAVFEDTISRIALEDAPVIPVVVASEPMVITEAETPAEAPALHIALAEEPVVVPTTEAAVFEDTISRTALEDAPAIPEVIASEPMVITEAETPAEAPALHIALAEEPVVVPTTEAAVFEDTISRVALEDAPAIPEVIASEPIAVTEAEIPAEAPALHITLDETVESAPISEAVVYENTVAAVTLENEPVIPVVVANEPMVITEAETPAEAPALHIALDETVESAPISEAVVYENTVAAVTLEDTLAIPEVIVSEPIVVTEAETPAEAPALHITLDETVESAPISEAVVYENTVAAVTLENEPVIPVVVASEPMVITEAETPAEAPALHITLDETVESAPISEAFVYENNVAAVTLESEPVIPVVVANEPIVITEAEIPKEAPTLQITTQEEVITVPVTKTLVYESNEGITVLEDQAYVAKTHPETIEKVTEPTVLSTITEDTKRVTVKETVKSKKPAEEKTETSTIVATRTTIIEDNKVVAQLTEYKTVKEGEAPANTILADEPKKETEPKDKKSAHISTIPTGETGNVKREDPMISVIPPINAKGVGSNAAETPFVLPATEDGRKTMATYAPAAKEDEPSFESALRRAEDIPVAPMIDVTKASEPAPAPAPAPAPTPTPSGDPEVIVADADVEVLYEDNLPEPETEPEIEEPAEEVIEEPVEEAIEEPAEEIVEEATIEPEVEEPVEEPEIEEPEIEEPVTQEPEIEEPVAEEPEVEEPAPVFTDAIHADELMTDEEAEEHIEIIEEEPGKERTGKMDIVNLDTICESFEDGEEVTLEALKEKKLISKKMGRVKILARGTMTKKLDIIADSFSLQAVKMITLAGGRAEQYK